MKTFRLFLIITIVGILSLLIVNVLHISSRREPKYDTVSSESVKKIDTHTEKLLRKPKRNPLSDEQINCPEQKETIIQSAEGVKYSSKNLFKKMKMPIPAWTSFLPDLFQAINDDTFTLAEYKKRYKIAMEPGATLIEQIQNQQRNMDAYKAARLQNHYGWDTSKDVFLDLGSSVGFYSYESLYELPHIRTISVEAHPINRMRFRQTVLLNGWEKRAYMPSCGVSDEEATTYINDNCGKGCTSHFVSRDVNSTEDYNKMMKTEEGNRTFEIQVKPLNTILDEAILAGFLGSYKEIKFVKMDIEGFEGYAFDGGDRFFRTARPIVKIECNYDFLKLNGETCYSIFERFFELGDYVCLTEGPTILTGTQLKVEGVFTELYIVPRERDVKRFIKFYGGPRKMSICDLSDLGIENIP